MMLPPMRMKVTILLTVLLSMMACAVQASTFAMPGIGTVNGLAVEIVKVTTNPTGAMDAVDRTGPVGGSSVSVYVKVQYGNAITSINSVAVSIRESGVGSPIANLSLSSYTQLADSGSGDATVHTRVYTGAWNTLTTTPKIYNVNYCFKATVDYDRNNSHASPAVDSDEVSVPVKNLWITSSTYDRCYFLRSPGQSTATSITVNFDHYKTGVTFAVEVTIRTTRDNQTTIATLTTTTTSHSATLSWNPSADDYPWGGYFCYDAKVTYGTDNATLISPTCAVTSDAVSFPNSTTAAFEYSLSESPKSGSVTVAFYEDIDPLQEVTGLSDQTRGAGNPVTITIAESVESCRAIISGKDNHTDNRGKSEQPFLPANNGKGYVLYRCFKFVLNNGTDSQLVTMYKKWDLDTSTWEVTPTAEPGKTFTANSGRSEKYTTEPYVYDYLNKDSVAAQRDEKNSPTEHSFGPLPTHASCVENAGRPWQVDFESEHPSGGLKDPANWTWGDFVWRDSTATETSPDPPVDGHTIHQRYYQTSWGNDRLVDRRFIIYNVNGGDSSTIRFTGKTDVTRTEFRLHEDTNYNYPGGNKKERCKGTAGCVGLVPGGMKVLYPQLDAMSSYSWKSTYDGRGTDYLPLHVFPSTGGNLTEWTYKKCRD